MTYIKCVIHFLEQQEPGMPIYSDRVAEVIADEYGITKKKASASAAVALKRIMDRREMSDLRCYQKGVYYRVVSTPFGETGIKKERLISDKYLRNDSGYETGTYLLYHLGLTTQIPTKQMIATNAAGDCVRFDKKLEVLICPPKMFINADNKAYLQLLDALELMDKAPVDIDQPYVILAEHIKKNNLKYETLLSIADRYYNQKTIIRLAHTASVGWGEHETA